MADTAEPTSLSQGQHREQSDVNIESLRFATSFATIGWEAKILQDPDHRREWIAPDRCEVENQFDPVPNSLPSTVTLAVMRYLFAKQLDLFGAHAVEVNSITIASAEAVCYIAKQPKQPIGVNYICQINFLFVDFILRIVILSPELGATGIREAILLSRHLADSRRPILNKSESFPSDWNPGAKEFATHPISKLRCLIEHIRPTAAMREDVICLARFPTPK